MRRKNDECSFVSLRDVQRCLKIMVWFYKHDNIFAEMDEVIARDSDCTYNVTDCSDHNVSCEDDADSDDCDDLEKESVCYMFSNSVIKIKSNKD